jgi:hypothetical protein
MDNSRVETIGRMAKMDEALTCRVEHMFARRFEIFPSVETVGEPAARLRLRSRRGYRSGRAATLECHGASAVLVGTSDIRRTSHNREAAIPHPELPLKGAGERRARLAFRSGVTQHRQSEYSSTFASS